MSASTPQEIDLVVLFTRFLKFIKKYFWLFVIGLVIGMIIGFVKCKLSKPSYRSRIVATTSHISLYFAVDMINILDDLIAEKNYDQISQKLGIEKNISEQLKKIEAKPIRDNPEKDPNRFEIAVKIFDNQYLEDIAVGLDTYISSNPYTRERYELFKSSTKELIQKIDSEIVEMDEFQKEMYLNMSDKQNQPYILGLGDESSIQSRLVGLYKEKQALKSRLQLNRPFIIIEGFTKYIEPAVSDLMYCLIYSMIFLGLAFVFAVAKEILIFLKKIDS